MTAARIARRLVRAEPIERDLVGRLLLTGIAESDAWVTGHEKTVFAILTILLLIGSAL